MIKIIFERNSELRKQQKNDFEKDFLKFLMNNSVLEKEMKNLRKLVDIK